MSMQVFQQKLVTTATQMTMEILNVFNQASNGALILGTGQVLKDTIEKLSFGLIDGLVTARNPYAAPGTAKNHKVLAQLLTNSVNGSLGIGPVTMNDTLANKIATSVDEAAAIVATQAAEGILKAFVTTGVGAASGAIDAGTATFAGLTRTQDALATAAAPAGSVYPRLNDFPLACTAFGDRQDEIRTWIMSGAQWLQFTAYQALPSAQQVFALTNFKVLSDGLGKTFLISDAASSAAGGSIIGLTAGAVALTQNGLRMTAGQVLGEENIRTIWQGEIDYSVSVKGYKGTSALINKATSGTITPADFALAESWELNQPPVVGSSAAADDGMILPDNRIQKDTTAGARQKKPAISVKETAGVKLVLTATTAPATTA